MSSFSLSLRIAGLCLAVLGSVLCALCEILLAWPVAWWVYLPLLLIAGLALLRPVPPQRQPAGFAGFLAVTGVLLTLFFVEWTSRKPFLRDLARVRVGMTEAEVRRVMAGHLEGSGWPVPPGDASGNNPPLSTVNTGDARPATTTSTGQLTLRDALVFRHSNVGRFNSDWGIVSMSNGCVVRVEFSPD